VGGFEHAEAGEIHGGISAQAGCDVDGGRGAAFDFHSGRTKQAPRWMQRSGLEWLYRLGSEPRRLGRRYLRNNPLFVSKFLAQRAGLKKYPNP